MLDVSLETVRVFLHVLAATVWVGGQLTLAALAPVVRQGGSELTRRVARRFGAIAWSAFAVLLATGVWNVSEQWDRVEASDSYTNTLILKVSLVVVSGVTAFVHTRARSRPMLAAFGAASGLSALAALFLGVLLG